MDIGHYIIHDGMNGVQILLCTQSVCVYSLECLLISIFRSGVFLISCYVCRNRMAASSDDWACSLMRGNRKPLAETSSNNFSIIYVFSPNMLYNVKRLNCSGTSWTG